jgi:hypothetical protein
MGESKAAYNGNGQVITATSLDNKMTAATAA